MEHGSQFDVVIAGGGTAGSALAGLLAGEKELSVCLVEAGPDYGTLESGNWPEDLLDAATIPADSHSWGYSGIAHQSQSDSTTYDRARVIGGCSSHNGCIALLGHYRDYDHWVNIGNPGWAFGSVRPSFLRAMERLRVRQPDDDELTPFQALFLGGAIGADIPKSNDLNHSGDTSGVAPAPVNIADGVRWNTALAYLTDDVRKSGNLTILEEAIVDRIVFDGDRATGIVVRRNHEEQTINAKRVVLSAGAYGSPAILERSGIGDPDVLNAVGIDVKFKLPGVGKSLSDHPALRLSYRASDELNREMAEFRQAGWCPDEQALVKACSSHCDDAFDLHLYSVTGYDESADEWRYEVYVSCVFPTSRGEVHVVSDDPERAPAIDHGFLTDPDRRDLLVLKDGIDLARKIMQPAIDSGVLEEEAHPGRNIESPEDVSQYIEQSVGIYYHPTSSCRMGPSTDPNAVVDSLGRVRGIGDLWICDTSIFPVLMRANTNLPAVMVAEHLAPVIAAGR